MTSPEVLDILPTENSSTVPLDPDYFKQEDLPVDIVRRNGNKLNYNDFYWDYMDRNWPVVLTDVSTHWECRRNWIVTPTAPETETTEVDNQQIKDDTVVTTTTTTTTTTATAINYDYLRQKMGNCRVPVADCSREYFNSHLKTEMCFHDFLDHWQARQNSNCVTDAINSNTTEAVGDSTLQPNYYLKDWHLKAQMPDYDFYQVPKHFASDWLNEHLITSGLDDYRFVYMGPKDSWTPFHADVFGSYSWSTNIVGCKKWLLLPPGEEKKLCNHLGSLPFRIDEQLLDAKGVRYYTVMQSENEALFVPTGWHHQVWNLNDTISINHNWINACNVMRVWKNLCINMRQVMAEIDDCRQMDNFDDHCQTMLRASFGMNHMDFLEMIEGVADRRILHTPDYDCYYSAATGFLMFNTYALNVFHLRHDLRHIIKVVTSMLDDEIICNSRTLLFKRSQQLLDLVLNSC